MERHTAGTLPPVRPKVKCMSASRGPGLKTHDLAAQLGQQKVSSGDEERDVQLPNEPNKCFVFNLGLRNGTTVTAD
jgi:hypothetical protein